VDGERHRAEHLLVAAGAWAPKVLPALAPVLRVQRQPLLWLRSSDPTFSLAGGAPTWGVETETGFFYGFPALSPGVVKLARHGGGEAADPDALDRTLREEDVEPVRAFAARHLSGVGPDVERHATCMYTMTADGNFVLGRAHPRVVYAAGLSGHGFKMATALGAALCELALDGRTRERVEFLSPDRPALRSSAPAPTSR
jgi:glycine/D-amino acid oxidase-like deaminating enzyme